MVCESNWDIQMNGIRHILLSGTEQCLYESNSNILKFMSQILRKKVKMDNLN